MELRNRLKALDAARYAQFEQLVATLSPLLTSIERVFPQFTRHDPAHNVRLETIAAQLLSEEATSRLTTCDLFVLLSVLWLHDAGMGEYPPLTASESATSAYQEALARAQRIGLSSSECWQQYVRTNHHRFCPRLAADLLSSAADPFLVHWIGRIAQSHGERTIHDRTSWPARVAVGPDAFIHPPILAVILRLADILHFDAERAPEYMLEHRHINNVVSIQHWRAHQAAAGFTISDDICHFDGVTSDDEAYWFAQQFLDAMDEELGYCKAQVLPGLESPWNAPLTFSRVERRIVPSEFLAGERPTTLRVNTPKLLEELLTDALYAGKPAWLRELLQNAFDACRDRYVRDTSQRPEVSIEYDSGTHSLSITDSGIGMTRSTVENFLLVAGSSYWDSDAYRSLAGPRAGHVGRFGIGFMSAFAVATRIEVETKHVTEPIAHRFTVRSARQVVRTEGADRRIPGTSIRLTLKAGALGSKDLVELLRDICTYPEFPLTLSIDGSVEHQVVHPKPPATDDGGYSVTETDRITAESRVASVAIVEPGLEGSFSLGKIYSSVLDAFVPDFRGWLSGAGWDVRGESKLHYGGVDYPQLHTLNPGIGFSFIPSIGSLRLAVSPNHYPLEMNLARDAFIPGPGTVRLFNKLVELLDCFFSEDLQQELAGKSADIRSALAARHSGAMLHLWAGQAPGLSAIAVSPPTSSHSPIPQTPWVRWTRLMTQELRYLTATRTLETQVLSLREIIDAESTVFAAGLLNGELSSDYCESIFAFSPDARLIFGLPDGDFGFEQLRHWSTDQILVPVDAHSRCAFGLRLSGTRTPFSFFPGPMTGLGIPSATGPAKFAALDYRDFMLEGSTRPLGGGAIVAALNEENEKVAALRAALGGYPDAGMLRRSLGTNYRQLREALVLGVGTRYRKDAGSQLLDALNRFCRSLGRGDLSFDRADIPSYWDGGEAVPFGRPIVARETIAALRELHQYDVLASALS